MKRSLFIVLGCIAVGLGGLGLFLPVLPTTPFLLLAAFFFLRSSERLYDWLIGHPLFGTYLYSYFTYKAVNPLARAIAMVMLWVGLILTALLTSHLWLKLVLLVVGIGVSIHLLRLRTLTPEQSAEIAELRQARRDFRAGAPD